MMHLNIFMTRQMVVEKYSIPPELESEIFSMLRPANGSGVNTRYLESMVDRQLHKYFANKDRPALAAVKSYLNEEDNKMIDAVGASNELANVLRDVFEWMKPRLATAFPDKAETPPVLSPEQVADRLRLNIQTVMKWCRQGRIQATKIGGKWLIPHESVEAYVRKCETIHGRAG